MKNSWLLFLICSCTCYFMACGGKDECKNENSYREPFTIETPVIPDAFSGCQIPENPAALLFLNQQDIFSVFHCDGFSNTLHGSKWGAEMHVSGVCRDASNTFDESWSLPEQNGFECSSLNGYREMDAFTSTAGISPEALNLLEAIKEPVDAGIIIKNLHTNFSQEGRNFLDVAFNNESIFKEAGEIAINNEQFILRTQNEIIELDAQGDDFFGSTVAFNIPTTDGSRDPDFSLGEYYFPEKIVLESPLEEAPIITDGTLIQWNVDSKNTNGVYIVLDYTSFDNPDQYNGHPERYVDFVKVEDDGRYIFDSHDFGLIPSNSLLVMKVIRGTFNFTKLDLENSTEYKDEIVRIIGYTQTAGYVRYQ